jgi:hypothetical protein
MMQTGIPVAGGNDFEVAEATQSSMPCLTVTHKFSDKVDEVVTALHVLVRPGIETAESIYVNHQDLVGFFRDVFSIDNKDDKTIRRLNYAKRKCIPIRVASYIFDEHDFTNSGQSRNNRDNEEFFPLQIYFPIFDLSLISQDFHIFILNLLFAITSKTHSSIPHDYAWDDLFTICWKANPRTVVHGLELREDEDNKGRTEGELK